MEHRDANDAWIRVLAEAQHGVVARRQLLEGMTGPRIRSWVDRGRLVRWHRGVYCLGHTRLSREGRWMAAVLACGAGALLIHRAAAALWGLRPPTGGPIEVTAPLGGPRRPGVGIRPRESGLVFPRLATVADGIPVTTVAWTLLEVAAQLRPYQLRRAAEQADRLELFDLRAVEAALMVDPGRPGSPALVALLDDLRTQGMPLTRSDVEAAMLQICIDHRLPRPQVNHYDNGKEVDFRWPAHHLVVEVDGWSFHRSRRAFTDDRARDRAALRAGWRVARFPASEVERSPAAVGVELTALLVRDAGRS